MAEYNNISSLPGLSLDNLLFDMVDNISGWESFMLEIPNVTVVKKPQGEITDDYVSDNFEGHEFFREADLIERLDFGEDLKMTYYCFLNDGTCSKFLYGNFDTMKKFDTWEEGMKNLAVNGNISK